MMVGGIIIVADMGLTRAVAGSNSKCGRWLPAIYFIFSRAGCEAVLRVV